jgi:hypothetical protein
VLSIAIGGRSFAGKAASRARATPCLDVDQRVGRVGGAFEIDERHAAHLPGARDHVLDLVLGRAGGEIEPLHPEAAEDAAIRVSVAA